MAELNQLLDIFTCITCRVGFQDVQLQRLHYKTDWHRYNLKRKVAELPPVTAEDFQTRVLNQRIADELKTADTTVYCGTCRKSFGTPNAFDNHLHSKKHKNKLKENEIRAHTTLAGQDAPRLAIDADDSAHNSDAEIEEIDSDEWDEVENPIDNNNCLFCLQHSGSFIKNVEHMTIVHSFFIPDIEYCSDMNGLLKYLGEKISEGFMCLWCNEKGRTFHSADAARQHMVDKGHCKMIYEGIALAEYADFYDYSSSYPDAEREDVDADEEVTTPVLDGDDYQLVLPSGVQVGHRSLMRYYKQRIDPNRSVALPSITKKLHKVLGCYRLLGWTETQQDAAARRARDIHYLKRAQAKYNVKMGSKNNSLLQKHFRRQVQF